MLVTYMIGRENTLEERQGGRKGRGARKRGSERKRAREREGERQKESEVERERSKCHCWPESCIRVVI